MNLEPCKICGKMPKVIEGSVCVIRCKPFMKRTHWTVEAPTLNDAIKYWNDRMSEIQAFKSTFKTEA